jgi:hypothetical protein
MFIDIVIYLFAAYGIALSAFTVMNILSFIGHAIVDTIKEYRQ